MDPTSLIIMMLIKAAQPTAEKAIADAYRALRTTLIRKYGARLAGPIQALELQPNSSHLQSALANELQLSGADRDPEVVALTDDLSYLVENLTLPPQRGSRVERAKRRGGAQALHSVMDTHVSRVLRARSSFNVDDAELLTPNLASSNLPDGVRDEIGMLHTTMRNLIATIAERLENDAYREAESGLQGDQLGLKERERAMDLVQADRSLHTSYQTLQLTVEYFREFNEHLLQRIETEPTAQVESRLLLGNAVMIYEVADFVIAFIRAFAPVGREDIQRMWEDRQERINVRRREEADFRQRVLASDSSQDVREEMLSNIDDRLKALDEAEQEWRSYIEETNQLSGMVSDVQRRTGTLEIIRDNAAGQIATLQEVALLRFLKQNTSAINRTVDAVSAFRLAPLTPTRIHRLLSV